MITIRSVLVYARTYAFLLGEVTQVTVILIKKCSQKCHKISQITLLTVFFFSKMLFGDLCEIFLGSFSKYLRVSFIAVEMIFKFFTNGLNSQFQDNDMEHNASRKNISQCFSSNDFIIKMTEALGRGHLLFSAF